MRLGRLQLAAIIVGGLLGLTGGLGLFTFVYADGASYLTNDPKACANCHVMNEQYDGWTRSSHHAVAVCNDCHTPHNFVGKWTIKGINGFNHSLAFTTGRFHEPIMATALNRSVTENACRYCHADIVQAIDSGPHADVQMSCIRCHRNVGHLH